MAFGFGRRWHQICLHQGNKQGGAPFTEKQPRAGVDVRGSSGDPAMKDAFIILGRVLALALTYSLLLVLLGVLAEDSHAAAVMASASPVIVTK